MGYLRFFFFFRILHLLRQVIKTDCDFFLDRQSVRAFKYKCFPN